MIIDTHSHLNFDAYKDDLGAVIKRAQKEGIACIDVGTDYETSKGAVELANKYDGIYAAIGMHPSNIGKEIFDYEKYKELKKSEKVVAIGEIGLDYFSKPKTAKKLIDFKEKQKEILLKQLDLAKELDLAVIFHCRMAHQDLIDVLRNMPEIRGVIHCFTGSWQEAKQYLDMGLHLGINGIMFKADLSETIKNAPIEKLLVETDCPYLTPPQEEGRRNEPLFIKYVIEKMAEIRKIGYNKIAEETFNNAKKLFKIL